jgi:hypothetical protein
MPKKNKKKKKKTAVATSKSGDSGGNKKTEVDQKKAVPAPNEKSQDAANTKAAQQTAAAAAAPASTAAASHPVPPAEQKQKHTPAAAPPQSQPPAAAPSAGVFVGTLEVGDVEPKPQDKEKEEGEEEQPTESAAAEAPAEAEAEVEADAEAEAEEQHSSELAAAIAAADDENECDEDGEPAKEEAKAPPASKAADSERDFKSPAAASTKPHSHLDVKHVPAPIATAAPVRFKVLDLSKPKPPPKVCLIQLRLSADDLVHCFLFLEPYTVASQLSRVCKAWSAVSCDEIVWRAACDRLGWNADTQPATARALEHTHHNSYRAMFIDRPHLRFDGYYLLETRYVDALLSCLHGTSVR